MSIAVAALAMGTIAPSAAATRGRPAAARPQPSIADRYAKADAFLGRPLAKLVVDARVDARFVSKDRAILWRTGPIGQRLIRLRDIASGAERTLTTEDRIATLLAAALPKRKVEADRLPFADPDVDPDTGALTFGAFDRRWSFADDRLSDITPPPTDARQGSVSPDGRFRIVARGYDLVAIDRSGREIALTQDGTREQPYGRGIAVLPDILREGTEEPTMPVAVTWSPDGSKIATFRLDTRGVAPLSITQQSSDTGLPRSFRYIYPLAGAPNVPMAERLVIDIAQAFATGHADIVPIRAPREPLLYPYNPNLDWEGGKVRFQWTERGYGQLVWYTADPATGVATPVVQEAIKPLVTVTATALTPAPDLGGNLLISERTGFGQLYLVTPDAPAGGRPLTQGAWEVSSIDHVDAKAGTILVQGIGREPDRNPYWNQLYRVPVDGGAPTLLTPEPLDHSIKLSDDGKWAIDAMSSPTTPSVTVLRDTITGKIVAELAHADISALLKTGYRMPEPFVGRAADGQTRLYGMIYHPAAFDPHRRYPVIDNVYTGPTNNQVPTTFYDTVVSAPSSVAQIGAVVVLIDGRGTSRRGRIFRLPAYRNLGEVGIDDHIAMIRQMAQTDPSLDTTRVGVFGGSAGGYDAARFVLRRPEFFKVAVASSGNHDLRLDKAWWPEVSMGLADADTWERNSNMSVASRLTGKLLLIHGDIDDNVPVTESFRLAQKLIEAERDVDLVILPKTNHQVFQPFFWRKLRDYFTRNLLDEAPPPLGPAPTEKRDRP